jgi:hypothetical protein
MDERTPKQINQDRVTRMINTLQSKLLDLFERSIITQSILTLIVFGTISYLMITSQPIPDSLIQFGSIIIGFFFGSKVLMSQRRDI